MKTQPESRFAIGVDFGGTSIKCALVSDGAIVRYGTTIHTREEKDVGALVGRIAASVNALKTPEVEAVGIGLPGLVDSVRGVVHDLPNVPGWNDVPLAERLHALTGLRVTMDNDANAMAFGEFRYGAGKGRRNVIFITLGTGVGGGLVLNGELYRGAQFGAGEIGQASIEFDGRAGNFGNFGALDKYVGNEAISARAADAYAAAGLPRSGDVLTPAALAAAAESGDPVARQVWQEIGDRLGAALANIVWLLNPDAIVIGGGVAKAGPCLFDPMEASLRQRTSGVIFDLLDILPASLGTDAGMIGSATLALEQSRSWSA